VTRERLYIDAVQDVMQNSSKVMIDVEGGNNMIYLPLDKIVGGASTGSSAGGQRSNNVDVSELADQVVKDLIDRGVVTSSRRSSFSRGAQN
jgi:membrane protease subunit HflK